LTGLTRYLLVECTGPVASLLVNRFGCRVVSIVGSVIAGVAFAVSQFSPSIEVMILIYGVMGGLLWMDIAQLYICSKKYTF